MTTVRLLISSLRHHRAVNAAVVLGIAVAVAVLAGALLVGVSVRESLREIALRRLGATDLIVSSASFVRGTLADEIADDATAREAFRSVVPLIVLNGAVVHEDSQRVATRVQVLGIDARFGPFHGVDDVAISGRDALVSPALAAELGAQINDSLVLRIAKPTDIPLGTLQGRREDVGERIRLTMKAVLEADRLGELSLIPAQGPVLTLFVPIERLQRDLDLGPRVNALLVATRSRPEGLRSVREDLRDGREDLVERGRAALKAHLALADLGLTIRSSSDARTLVVESRAGVIQTTLADRVAAVAKELDTTSQPVLAYLANTIRIGAREIPYSLVAAVDLQEAEASLLAEAEASLLAEAEASLLAEAEASALRTRKNSGDLPVRTEGQGLSPGRQAIWLNEWAASDLAAKPGDEVSIEYYLWSDASGLTTGRASFVFAGVMPMNGPGGDRTLVPEYPGVTDASTISSWDPPFPVELSRVRPKDEKYWEEYRTAPKAFLRLARGQELWPSSFGSVSSLRIAVPLTSDAARFESRLREALLASIDPFAAGMAIRDVRAEALQSATGTTDFGEYFVYFSFFLVIAGLLLAGVFFVLGAEQRTREIGLLGALGFRPRAVRGVLMREAVVLTIIGGIIGAAAAIGYAALIMYGLRTWWVGAVGTTALRLHVDPLTVLAGTAGAFVAALAALALALRRLLRRSPRDLLTGDATSPLVTPSSTRARTRAWLGTGLAIAAIALAAASAFGAMNQVAGFFACGGLLLLAGLMGYSAWLWRDRSGVGSAAGQYGPSSVMRLGIQYSRWRPGRSVLSAALIAFACFVLVAVGAFRRDPVGDSLDRQSGNGGFALMAESVAPLMYDPNTPAGRDDLGLSSDAPLFANAHIARFRLRPGDEVSCLTLYQPTSPRIIAPEPRFVDEGRFAFAASLASTPEERANPWRLLHRRFDDGAIPAIVDQTSLMYVFHLALGDDFTFTPDGGAPLTLRIVATLADSVLQSEMIISDEAFVRVFPRQEGYRLWLVETPADQATAVATELERQLADYGLDTIDTRARLAAYHQVENTYLSTFQTLGALGLLVGTVGLAAVLARNVLERRRELGLMRAVGYSPGHLRTLVLAESATLIIGGLLLGSIAALIAVSPVLAERVQALPIGSLVMLLAAVIVTGLLASIGAIRLTTATSVVDAVKTE